MADRLSDRTRAARMEFERLDEVMGRALDRVAEVEGLQFSSAPAAFSGVLGPDGRPAGGGGGGGGPVPAGGADGRFYTIKAPAGGVATTSDRGYSGELVMGQRAEEADRLVAPEYCLTESGGRTGGPALPTTTILSEGTAVTLPNGSVIGYRVGACFYRADAVADPRRVGSSARGGVVSSGGGGGGGGGRGGGGRIPRITGGPDGGAQTGFLGRHSGKASVEQSFDLGAGIERGLTEVATEVRGLRRDLATGDGGAGMAFRGLG